MLPLDVSLAPNLMTAEAVAAAEHAIAQVGSSKRPGIIQVDRLRRNLLSSQPLCFNLFGYLGAHREALLPWVRSLAPSATEITRVELEWAPETGTIGKSAFDALVEYALPGGQRGFLGVECKYAENLKMSLRGPAAQKYRDATTGPSWIGGAIEALDVTGLRQFWFNQLLVEIVRHGGDYAEGTGVIVACSADSRAAEAAAVVAAQLSDAEGLRFSSLESVVASVAGHAKWAHEFRERYLDFSPIAHRLPEDDPRRAGA
jgi:hypothetical protein